MIDILMTARTVLKTTPGRWIELADSLPPQLMKEPPAPNEWSALECLQHLIDAERFVFPVRVKALLAGQDFPAYHPDREGAPLNDERLPADLAGEFLALRAESLELLDSVRDGDLARQARHQELGNVSLSELLHEWAGHDLMHTIQAERALMQPFIRGCGPWQIYFKDHWVE